MTPHKKFGVYMPGSEPAEASIASSETGEFKISSSAWSKTVRSSMGMILLLDSAARERNAMPLIGTKPCRPENVK